jgi:hypothetical protein
MHTEKPKRRFVWWLALLLLSLGLAGLFVFGLQPLLVALIRPLVILFWFIDVLPEVVVWVVVVILGAVLAMWDRGSLTSRRPQREGEKAPVSSTENKGVDSISNLIQRAQVSSVARNIVGWQLAGVAVTLLCRRRCISPREAWQLMYREKWPMDQRVYGVLFPQQTLYPANEYLQNLGYAVSFLEHYDRGSMNDNR